MPFVSFNQGVRFLKSAIPVKVQSTPLARVCSFAIIRLLFFPDFHVSVVSQIFKTFDQYRYTFLNRYLFAVKFRNFYE